MAKRVYLFNEGGKDDRELLIADSSTISVLFVRNESGVM